MLGRLLARDNLTWDAGAVGAQHGNRPLTQRFEPRVHPLLRPHLPLLLDLRKRPVVGRRAISPDLLDQFVLVRIVIFHNRRWWFLGINAIRFYALVGLGLVNLLPLGWLVHDLNPVHRVVHVRIEHELSDLLWLGSVRLLAALALSADVWGLAVV